MKLKEYLENKYNIEIDDVDELYDMALNDLLMNISPNTAERPATPLEYLEWLIDINGLNEDHRQYAKDLVRKYQINTLADDRMSKVVWELLNYFP